MDTDQGRGSHFKSGALAERVARESYGRLLALLAARTRDVAAAEDALADAFTAALVSWPRGGAPNNPEAWLFAAARRKLIDAARRIKTASEGEAEIVRGIEELEAAVEKWTKERGEALVDVSRSRGQLTAVVKH